MAKRYLAKKTHRFHFLDADHTPRSYVLIFGDEIDTLTASAPSGPDWTAVKYRGREGEMKKPKLMNKRALEMYFLDVGQGDAAFVVTPNNVKILVDGGLKDRALGFLIWKYRLDQPNTSVHIDYLILSHADSDHVQGLIPILRHPKISVSHIMHNGIGSFKSGFSTTLGDVVDKELVTLHSAATDLHGHTLSREFGKWIDAVVASGAVYESVDTSTGLLDVGDPDVTIEILGPKKEANGSLKWFSNRAHTINGHSVVFRLTYGDTRTFFSGDLNTEGSKHLLADDTIKTNLDSHVLKSPHHGSHDFYQPLFEAVRPQITVVSSGDSPDHGHPRALFLGGIGKAGRGAEPLVFSTEIAATFADAGDANAVTVIEPTTLGDLDFSTSAANTVAKRRFKKTLPGIINVRTDGSSLYAMRRVSAGYQWESYGPLKLYEWVVQ